VIIDNLDVVGIYSIPPETDSVLVVHSHAVLAGAVAPENLEMVSWNPLEVSQVPSGIQGREAPAGRPFNCLILSRELVLKKLLRFGVPKRYDHRFSL